MSLNNAKILIIGGTGSLGNKLTERYLENNTIYLYSRDECKHWSMGIDYNHHPNLNFIIGNIADKEKIKQTIVRHNFDIIIMAAALKHIDKCEYETNECLNTNLFGTKNVLDEIENNLKLLTNLKTVCFISTDKACSPINVYGCCKNISENIFIELSNKLENYKKYNKIDNNYKIVIVRYGNVLNSRGSIIPLLHTIGNDDNKDYFTITDERMTRFVMTLEQSVDLIEHTIINGETGDTVIPKLLSMNVKDLVEIFSEKYIKPIKIIGLKPGEKLLESLINESQSLRITHNGDYTHIKSVFTCNEIDNTNLLYDYNSKVNTLQKDELKEYLINLRLL
jgi:FlaA1/EpsC-like NDP-sugar epimerase